MSPAVPPLATVKSASVGAVVGDVAAADEVHDLPEPDALLGQAAGVDERLLDHLRAADPRLGDRRGGEKRESGKGKYEREPGHGRSLIACR